MDRRPPHNKKLLSRLKRLPASLAARTSINKPSTATRERYTSLPIFTAAIKPYTMSTSARPLFQLPPSALMIADDNQVASNNLTTDHVMSLPDHTQPLPLPDYNLLTTKPSLPLDMSSGNKPWDKRHNHLTNDVGRASSIKDNGMGMASHVTDVASHVTSGVDVNSHVTNGMGVASHEYDDLCKGLDLSIFDDDDDDIDIVSCDIDVMSHDIAQAPVDIGPMVAKDKGPVVARPMVAKNKVPMVAKDKGIVGARDKRPMVTKGPMVAKDKGTMVAKGKRTVDTRDKRPMVAKGTMVAKGSMAARDTLTTSNKSHPGPMYEVGMATVNNVGVATSTGGCGLPTISCPMCTIELPKGSTCADLDSHLQHCIADDDIICID